MAKILCLIEQLGSGGAERQLSILASLLKESGHNVDVYSYYPVYFYEYILSRNGVNLIRESSNPTSLWNKWKRCWNVINTGNYDTVIAFSPGAVFASLIAKIIKRNFNLIVSDRHTTNSIGLKDLIKFHLYRFATYVVPNSYAQRDILATKFPFMRNKLHPITNFTEVSAYQDIIHKRVKNHPTLRILVVARHFPVKNANNFVKAIALLKDKNLNFHVTWVGNQNTECFELTRRLTNALAISDYIDYIDHQTSVSNFYINSDVLCQPSLCEGFSNAIGEALCSGLPVLCSKGVGDNERMVDNMVNGLFFDGYSPEDIADKIEKFYNLPIDIRIKMGTAALKKAQVIFSKERFIEEYNSLIR